ncbi:MAG: RloB family protein [Lactobacillus sp.]|jgi:hypothetical protein|nr:RloB family protein [Lactobacillus sp.]
MARKSKNIPYKKIIAIYCEGDSEKAYFEMLRRKYNSPNVHTEKIEKVSVNSLGLSGLSLLKKAKTKVDRLSKKKRVEKVYVVFDRDDFTEPDLQKCDVFARKNDITIIFSSINLEVWILMHYRPVHKQYTPNELNAILSSEDYFNTDYAKFKGNQYDEYLFDRIKTAKENADALQKRYQKPWYKNNLYTNINEEITNIFGVTEF